MQTPMSPERQEDVDIWRIRYQIKKQVMYVHAPIELCMQQSTFCNLWVGGVLAKTLLLLSPIYFFKEKQTHYTIWI